MNRLNIPSVLFSYTRIVDSLYFQRIWFCRLYTNRVDENIAARAKIGISEPIVYGDLVCDFKRTTGKPFSDQFKRSPGIMK